MNETSKRPARISGPRAIILGTLERVGGRLESDSGGATRELYELLVDQGVQVTEKGLVNSLAKMEGQGLITRDVRGKRTYAIATPLTDQETEITKLTAEGLTEEEIAERLSMSKRTVTRHLAGVHDKLGDRNLGQERSRDVGTEWRDLADALLRRVGEILAATDGGTNLRGIEGELGELKVRLAEALEERQRQVGKVVQLGEELVSVKAEREGLRARLRAAEDNIDKMLKDGGGGGGDRAFRALERFMQEKPMARR